MKSNITDDEIKAVFANTNFGDRDHRKLLEVSVMKRAVGYHCGHTITMIMRRLGLTGKTDNITMKGKRFLQHAYNDLMLNQGG